MPINADSEATFTVVTFFWTPCHTRARPVTMVSGQTWADNITIEKCCIFQRIMPIYYNNNGHLSGVFSSAPHGAVNRWRVPLRQPEVAAGLLWTVENVRRGRNWNFPIEQMISVTEYDNAFFRESTSDWWYNTNRRCLVKIPCLEVKKKSIERHLDWGRGRVSLFGERLENDATANAFYAKVPPNGIRIPVSGVLQKIACDIGRKRA